MKNKIIVLIIGCLVLMFNCKSKNELINQTKNKKKPNVLLLFSDQHNKKTMGFENHPDVITPNLDKLSTESMFLERVLSLKKFLKGHKHLFLHRLYQRLQIQ